MNRYRYFSLEGAMDLLKGVSVKGNLQTRISKQRDPFYPGGAEAKACNGATIRLMGSLQ